jgi:hypothetical protein
MPRVALVLLLALATALATGCEGDAEHPGLAVQQGGEQFLSATDTATVAQAEKDIAYVCRGVPVPRSQLVRDLDAAAAVAREYPDKVYDSGTVDRDRAMVLTIRVFARDLRACGEPGLAARLLRGAGVTPS